MGGGRSIDQDDSLFKFKKKFSNGHIRNLPLGFIVHEPNEYKKIIEKTNNQLKKMVTAEENPFGQLKASLFPYRA